MKKIIITAIFIIFSFHNILYAAGGSSGNSKSLYDQAVNLIKSAKKYEKKGKTNKANKRYEKALTLLIKENKKNLISQTLLIILASQQENLGILKMVKDIIYKVYK